MIKKICIVGDSHTWGEGAADNELKKFNIPVCPGDKRLLSFNIPSFPTLLRNYINKKTESESHEISGVDLSTSYKLDNVSECAYVCGELSVEAHFDFARAELKKGSADTEFFCDGELVKRFKAEESDEYEVINIIPRHTASRLNIKSSGALVYKIEFYSGKYAVINCGIGSCPSFRYNDEYLDKYVLSIAPTLVIAEVFTVNDWLSCKTPHECKENLISMGKRIIESGSCLAFSSVIPILGNQKNEIGVDYLEYVHAGSSAAQALKVQYADVYSAFSEEYGKKPLPSHYGDIWHPGPRGHEIYFEEIKKLDSISCL